LITKLLPLVIVLYVVTFLVAGQQERSGASIDDAMVTGLCAGFIVAFLLNLGLALVESKRY